MRRSAWLWLGLVSCITLSSIGCSLSGSSSSSSQLRFLLASPDAPQVNILIDGAAVANKLGYGNATAYVTVKSGSRHVQLVPVSGAAPIYDQSLSITSTTNQTLLFTGPVASLQPIMLSDTSPTIVTGDAFVRVVNASATMGAADVYIVPAGSSIAGVQPVKAGMTFDQNTGYQLTMAGNYEVFMTTPNTSNALLSTGSISLTAAQNQTVVALDGAAGGFMYARLTDQ